MCNRAYSRSAVILVMAAALLTGCGGGGGGYSSSTPPAPIPVQGVYFGTYSINGTPGSTPVYGAIQSGGYGYFADTQGVSYVLSSLTDSGSYSGTLTAYAPPGQTFPTGSSTASFSVSGGASDNGSYVTAVSGSFTGSGESGSFTINYQPITINALSLNALAGSYSGYYWGSGSTSIALTVNASGSFSGSDGYGCQLSGTLTPVPGYDLVQVTASSTGQPVCAGALSGLGFESTQDLSGQFSHAAGTYVYVGASNAKAGFAAELKLQ